MKVVYNVLVGAVVGMAVSVGISQAETFTCDNPEQLNEAFHVGYRAALTDVYLLCRDEQGFALEGDGEDKTFLCVERGKGGQYL